MKKEKNIMKIIDYDENEEKFLNEERKKHYENY